MIFKRTLHSKFTAISNAVCNDASISTDARWCLWYLLTKPVDWEVRVNDIRRVADWGREKTYKVINELIAAKYLVVSQSRDQGGQFGSINYDVYDEPFNAHPVPENPEADVPIAVNQEHTKDREVLTTDKIQNTEKNILFDAGFEEFWAAYPKRPGNPKKPAKLKYVNARKRSVPHETIMAGVNAYAQSRKGEDPKYTKLAETWLSKECWEVDYPAPSPRAADAATVSDEHLDAIVNQYKGIVSDRMAAKRILAAEIAGGASLDRIVEAAEKYAIHRKQMRYDGIEITAPILETWLKFKWREMDAYFISKSPMRKPILKPLSEKRK